jgi:aromatic-L-amino-acid decarboxylase
MHEESLDPENWEEMRLLGHRMVDEMMDYLQHVRDRPVWQPIPADVKEQFRKPLPSEPEGIERTYQDFLRYVLPYPTGNIHPRFWGWVMGNGTPFSMLAEMLAAGMNLNQGGGAQAGSLVEIQVLDWCKTMLGFPETASGILVSGGSMANLVGLTVARNAKARFNLRSEGLRGAPRAMVLYASSETHSSVQKGVELLGLGSSALHRIAVNSRFEIEPDLLREAIREDRSRGLEPFCVVGNAGTVNTGATDDLTALAEISRQEGLWFHVDGAFGALAALSPELRHVVSGIEYADSLAFDLHKWMSMPYEVGCTLVKDSVAHRRAFSLTPDYLEHTTRGIAGSDVWLSDYGVQLSRGFRALKVWMSIKEHGIEKFGRIIKQNVEQARYLAECVSREHELELVAPVPMNIVCFRYRGAGNDREKLDDLNRELLFELHEKGIAAPSYTVLDGKYALRVCITNHRSIRKDYDLLVNEVVKIGRELQKRGGTAG